MTITHTRPVAQGTPVRFIIAILAALGFFVVPAAQAHAANRVVIAGSSWLQGQGVDVMDDLAVSTADNYWQCVELPQMRLYPKFGWPRVYADGGASAGIYRYGAKYIPEGSPGLTRHNPGSGYLPVPGDLIVENGTASNGYGHVAVVDRIEGNNIIAVQQNRAGWHTYTYNNSNYAGGYGSIKAVMHAPQNHFSNGTAAEGSFVTYNGNVYRIAGGAPIYVSTWNVFGGGQPTTNLTEAQFNALRAYPADGTFVTGASSGKVYRFAGGAPEYVSTWSSFGGAQPVIGVDDYALDHPDGPVPLNHVRRYPADGTFISNTADGRVYRVAGGAPLYVSSWANIGGAQAVTSLDPYEFSAFQHLRAVPADMFLRGLPSQRVFRVVWGGHPYYVESWAPYGGTQPFLDVDDWAIDNCDHLNCDPFGALDSAISSGGGKVTVKGWAIDPNARTSPVRIHVYIGGPAGDKDAQGFDVGTETGTRDDIVTSFPGVGSKHGFSKTVTTTRRGSQPVYVYAINADGTRGNNAEIGHSTVTITNSLTTTPTPTISGTAAVGRTLTATPHTWKPAPVTLTYQWRSNTKPIPGATSKTYTLTAADKSNTITVTVTGSKAGYAPAFKTSKATGKVKAGALHTATPTITGIPVIGTPLTATPGTWSPAGITYTYRWYRNSSTIKGATSQTYTVQTADKGKRLRVRVYGHLIGYTTSSRLSATTVKAHA